MSGWQTMDSAPLDGREILTVCGRTQSVRYWGKGEDDEMAWQPRIRGIFPEFWQPLPPLPLTPLDKNGNPIDTYRPKLTKEEYTRQAINAQLGNTGDEYTRDVLNTLFVSRKDN